MAKIFPNWWKKQLSPDSQVQWITKKLNTKRSTYPHNSETFENKNSKTVLEAVKEQLLNMKGGNTLQLALISDMKQWKLESRGRTYIRSAERKKK